MGTDGAGPNAQATETPQPPIHGPPSCHLCRIDQHAFPSLCILRFHQTDTGQCGLRRIVNQETIDPMTPGKDGELPAAVPGDDSSADELGRELCAAIAEGAYDQGRSREQLLAWLRADVEARLRINDPALLERNARRDK